MKSIITRFDPSFPIVNLKTGLMTDAFRVWMLQVIERTLFIDSGSPEGVVVAQQGAEYLDEAGLAGSRLYIKQLADIAGDRSMGWVAIG